MADGLSSASAFGSGSGLERVCELIGREGDAGGRAEEVCALLADAPALLVATNRDGRGVLQLAVASRSVELVAALLARFGTQLNLAHQDDAGWTCVHQMCSAGAAAMFAAVADAATPADLNVRTRGGQTALHYAAGKGHVELVEALLVRGIDSTAADKLGHTALHRAATLGQVRTVAALLAHDPSLVNRADTLGNTALHYACEEGHEAVVRALIDGGADPHRENNDQCTARSLAATPTIAKLLLEQRSASQRPV